MDQWKKKSSLREEQFRQQGTISPSFSSTLLDSIYRSIDQGLEVEEEEEEEEQRGFHTETMKKKQSTTNNKYSAVKQEEEEEEVQKEMENRERRASMMDKWIMLEKNKEIRRKSPSDFDRKVLVANNNSNDRSSMFVHSTSSSSDSSSGGGFSSSEAESVYGSRARSSSVPTQRPKPVRTSVSVRPERNETHHHHHHHHQRIRSNSVPHEQQQKSKKHENGFIRTKSRALKIYGDLKKVKQPISPGGRLATFINSLFHAKKGKNSSNSVEDFRSERKSKSTTQTSTCSSASSFSRSCLSKAPPSNGKSSSNGIKRTVRFYPVSVIVDEDSRPCGEKSLYAEENKPKPNNLMLVDEREKNQRLIQEAARDLIVSYRKINGDFKMRDPLHNDDDDDDGASYASSDLFELDNLASIGIVDHNNRYSEELPVYETTHFQMNRAIANGFIL